MTMAATWRNKTMRVHPNADTSKSQTDGLIGVSSHEHVHLVGCAKNTLEQSRHAGRLTAG
jgi:hypothetical protein